MAEYVFSTFVRQTIRKMAIAQKTIKARMNLSTRLESLIFLFFYIKLLVNCIFISSKSCQRLDLINIFEKFKKMTVIEVSKVAGKTSIIPICIR
jgi:hypothetical protein